MTREQLQQIRDALLNIKSYGDVYRYKAHEVNPYVQLLEAIAILDAALAAPEQKPFCYHDGVNVVDPEFANDCDVFPLYTHPMPVPAPEPKPVGCEHKRYSVDVHEQTGTCYDCGAEGRMRFVVDDTAPPTHYDQTALELCEVCGWKTLIPGDCCLNCERKKVEQEPLATPQRVEYTPNQKIERFNLDVNIDGMDQMREFVLASDHDALVHALEANCDPAGMVQENCLLRDQTRQLGAMIDRLKKEAAPQREWQSLTPDEINNCAGAEIYPSTWGMSFARAIESKLKEKNHG